MDDKKLEEEIHRAELKHFLSENELTLPDEKREELLLQRKLVGQGLLGEMDLIANRKSIRNSARKLAISRNKFTFGSWLDSLPEWLQATLVILGFLLVSLILGMCSRLFE